MAKVLLVFGISFLAFLVTQGNAAYRGSSSSRNYYEREREALSNSSRDKGYEIVIKLDDAFGDAAEELKTLQKLAVDVKLMKVILEDIVPDIKHIKRFVDESKSTSSIQASRLESARDYLGDLMPRASCAELRLRGSRDSMVYTIRPSKDSDPVEVYCDMETDGGGWTVIQNRGVHNVPKSVREEFYRNWKDYENGFGSARSDYWLGLENIHALTKECNNELIVNLTSWDGSTKYARYGTFSLTGKRDYYRLRVGNYSGNAGDGLLNHNGMRFTTYDRHNDLNGEDNCAELYKGAWWYKDCFWSNLNGEYSDDGEEGKMSSRSGMEWSSRHFYSYKKTEMKIRPRC